MTARIVSRKVVDLNALDDPARRELGHALYRVHAQVFRGSDERDFCDHVLAPAARRNVVELYRNAAGDTVGYCALHFYDRRIAGRVTTMIWSQGGLLPTYRGGNATFRFGITQTLREKLRHPLRRLCFLSCLVHGSSYRLMNTYFPRVYPSPGHEMPADLQAMALEMAAGLLAPAVDPADPLVRNDGWITKEPDPAGASARFGALPDVAYFMQRNPGYVQGHGLLVLVPLGIFDISVALWRRFCRVLRR